MRELFFSLECCTLGSQLGEERIPLTSERSLVALLLLLALCVLPHLLSCTGCEVICQEKAVALKRLRIQLENCAPSGELDIFGVRHACRGSWMHGCVDLLLLRPPAQSARSRVG